MTVVCVFGDSIAWGAGDPKGGWVSRLSSNIQKSDYDVAVYNCGVRGDDTDSLLRRFEAEAAAREPDVIVFAIGINDSRYIKQTKDLDARINKFRKNLVALLNLAKKFTDRIVYVGLTRVDESKTVTAASDTVEYYSYNNETISRYDAEIKRACQENRADYIRMDDLLSVNDLEDGLHPNSSGHEKMFERIREFLFDKKTLTS